MNHFCSLTSLVGINLSGEGHTFSPSLVFAATDSACSQITRERPQRAQSWVHLKSLITHWLVKSHSEGDQRLGWRECSHKGRMHAADLKKKRSPGWLSVPVPSPQPTGPDRGQQPGLSRGQGSLSRLSVPLPPRGMRHHAMPFPLPATSDFTPSGLSTHSVLTVPGIPVSHRDGAPGTPQRAPVHNKQLCCPAASSQMAAGGSRAEMGWHGTGSTGTTAQLSPAHCPQH